MYYSKIVKTEQFQLSKMSSAKIMFLEVDLNTIPERYKHIESSGRDRVQGHTQYKNMCRFFSGEVRINYVDSESSRFEIIILGRDRKKERKKAYQIPIVFLASSSTKLFLLLADGHRFIHLGTDKI